MRIIQTADLRPDTRLSQAENDWIYNGLDCAVTLEIFEEISQLLDPQTRATYEFSKSLQAPILEMNLRGLLVNQNARSRIYTKFMEQMGQLQAQLHELVTQGIGAPFEPGFWKSHTKLKNLLYDVMNLPSIKKRTDKGYVPTTDRDALERLSVHFLAEPICSHILALRDLEKKRQFLETGIDPDGRMRTSFNIAGTNTGRLASALSDFGTGGNLQNVDRDLRSVFVADPGMIFINCDLEQGDSRNLGALCWDVFVEEKGEQYAGGYLDLCESGDLHTQVSRMARPTLPWTDDPKNNRAIADQIFYRNYSYRDLDKRLGHGSNYLGTPVTMAKHAKVPKMEVEEFQRNYFRRVPCIPSYHDYVRKEIAEVGSLTTLFGRRRRFYGRPTDSATIREAVAYSPQSMTAEEINIGMLNLFRSGRVQLLVQVHDSILFQVPERDVNTIVPWALEALKAPLTLRRGRQFVVPTEAKVGYNWGDASKENVDGSVKWKGSEMRKRQEVSTRLDLRGW